MIKNYKKLEDIRLKKTGLNNIKEELKFSFNVTLHVFSFFNIFISFLIYISTNMNVDMELSTLTPYVSYTIFVLSMLYLLKVFHVAFLKKKNLPISDKNKKMSLMKFALKQINENMQKKDLIEFSRIVNELDTKSKFEYYNLIKTEGKTERDRSCYFILKRELEKLNNEEDFIIDEFESKIKKENKIKIKNIIK